MVGLRGRITAGEEDPFAIRRELRMEMRFLPAAVSGPIAAEFQPLIAFLVVQPH